MTCRPDDNAGTLSLTLGMRAEILLTRGPVERGLELWREAADRWTSSLDAVYRDEAVGRSWRMPPPCLSMPTTAGSTSPSDSSRIWAPRLERR